MKRTRMNAILIFVGLFVFGPAMAASHHAHEAKSVDPATAMRWLANGNKRFVSGHNRHDGKSTTDRKKLVKGQNPHTIVLSCSDSRVPPEHVFDQALGEIFVIRVAGEALDSAVIASMEYAVEHLGTRNIVVMGHTHCGAVKAAMAAKAGESNGSPSLDQLVSDIKPRLPASDPGETASSDVARESGANAKQIAMELSSRSKIIEHKVQSGLVKVNAALYDLQTGKVQFY
ncbi:MAG: carbonic anhydrase [Oligoflexia bacterium]|nr:carbonic anhydrase [Oligoflexia bacterium]